MKNLIASTALALLLGQAALADGLTARVNSPQVAVGDQFQLVLSSETAGTAPDLTPLHEDFNVLGTSQSMQTQIVNGHASQSINWIVTLSPKAPGQLTIPALSAGALSSDPLTVTALNASDMPKAQGASGVSVETSLAEGPHYLFQEIPLTVRIETTQPLRRAELIAPAGDFDLTQSGRDRTSQITRGGQTVNVIERSYMLRPQREGALTIPPFALRGMVSDPNGRRDPFGTGFGGGFGGRDPFAMMDEMMAQMGGHRMGSLFDDVFASGTSFTVRSDALSLDVQANPAGSGNWFLPATAVELQAEWEPANPVFREGEAVTRRVSLLALGARPEQLPDLTFNDANGARIYLDDTTTNMVDTTEGTVARRDFVISVVPTQGGPVTLPEITVEWFDTAENTAKTASLPAVTLEVEGTIPAATPDAQIPPAPVPAETAPHDATDIAWITIAAGISGAIALVLAGLAIMRRRKVDPHKQDKAPNPLADLKTAAKAGDQMRFYQTLLSLDKSARAQPAVKQAMTALERARFAPVQEAAPDLNALCRQVSGALDATSKRQTRKLPALYPNVTSTDHA